MQTAFIKLESDIPSCCKVRASEPDLNFEHQLARLPEDPDNGHMEDRRRHRWLLRHQSDGDTSLLEQWPEMLDYLDSFPGKCVKAHISLLSPNTKIGVHRDGFDQRGNLSDQYELFNRTLRFHVPLITNGQVQIFSDGKLYRMSKGELWMLNNMKTHSAINEHPTLERYHLIFDVEPNMETMAMIDRADAQLGVQDQAALAGYWPELYAKSGWQNWLPDFLRKQIRSKTSEEKRF